MARVVILGAGISGHTAALHLRRKLAKEHEVVVVAPNAKWNWIPSNIWVGVGRMTAEQVTFPLAPIYQRKGIEFHQALGIAIHPEGDSEHAKPFVDITYTDPARAGQTATLEYDYLINATGPKLNFARHRGPRPRREQPLGVHRGPRHRGSRSAGPGDREDACRAAPDDRRRNRARHLHLRGCGLRVRVQRRARAAPGRRSRHGRPRVPDQRVRARRLRRRRHGVHPEGVPDHQQDLDRVAVPRARDARDPRRPRREGRARGHPLRAARRHPPHPGLRLRDAAPPVPRART